MFRTSKHDVMGDTRIINVVAELNMYLIQKEGREDKEVARWKNHINRLDTRREKDLWSPVL